MLIKFCSILDCVLLDNIAVDDQRHVPVRLAPGKIFEILDGLWLRLINVVAKIELVISGVTHRRRKMIGLSVVKGVGVHNRSQAQSCNLQVLRCIVYVIVDLEIWDHMRS